MCIYVFTNPSKQSGCDTKSILSWVWIKSFSSPRPVAMLSAILSEWIPYFYRKKRMPMPGLYDDKAGDKKDIYPYSKRDMGLWWNST